MARPDIETLFGANSPLRPDQQTITQSTPKGEKVDFIRKMRLKGWMANLAEEWYT